MKNMNNEDKEETLKQLKNTQVIIKHTNGRTISGVLKETNGAYTLKLGVKILPILPANITQITPLT